MTRHTLYGVMLRGQHLSVTLLNDSLNSQRHKACFVFLCPRPHPPRPSSGVLLSVQISVSVVRASSYQYLTLTGCDVIGMWVSSVTAGRNVWNVRCILSVLHLLPHLLPIKTLCDSVSNSSYGKTTSTTFFSSLTEAQHTDLKSEVIN